MTPEEAQNVLTAFDKEAQKYKDFESSFRRLNNVRVEVVNELSKSVKTPESNNLTEKLISPGATRVQEFYKSSERIAAMINEEMKQENKE